MTDTYLHNISYNSKKKLKRNKCIKCSKQIFEWARQMRFVLFNTFRTVL